MIKYMIELFMDFKKLIIVFFISILVVGCQTIKEKTDAIAEKDL